MASVFRDLTSFWQPGPVTDVLQPVVRRLLDVADRLTQNEPVDTDELISEFVYVMY